MSLRRCQTETPHRVRRVVAHVWQARDARKWLLFLLACVAAPTLSCAREAHKSDLTVLVARLQHSEDAYFALLKLQIIGKDAAPAIPAVLPFMSRPSSVFREDDLLRAATGMLTAIGQPALVPLSEYLGGAPDPETCHRVSAVLGIIGQERAIPFLRPLLASSDRQRQQCAITALEQIRDANAIRSIEHMLSEEDRAALLASRNIVAAYNNDVDVDKAAIVLRTFADGISAARMNAEQQRVQSAMLADAEQVHLLLSSANRDALVTLGNAVVEPLSRAIPKAFMEDLEHVADVLGRARSPLAITGLLQIVDLASHWTFSPGTGGSSASYEVAAHNMRVARTYEAVTLALFRIGPPGLDRLKNELTNQTDDVRLKLAQVLVEIEHDSDLARPRPN